MALVPLAFNFVTSVSAALLSDLMHEMLRRSLPRMAPNAHGDEEAQSFPSLLPLRLARLRLHDAHVVLADRVCKIRHTRAIDHQRPANAKGLATNIAGTSAASA